MEQVTNQNCVKIAEIMQNSELTQFNNNLILLRLKIERELLNISSNYFYCETNIDSISFAISEKVVISIMNNYDDNNELLASLMESPIMQRYYSHLYNICGDLLGNGIIMRQIIFSEAMKLCHTDILRFINKYQ
jgi:hypothetical protein